MTDLVLMTKAGRMIGVELEEHGEEGERVMRDAIRTLIGLCDAADEQKWHEVRGIVFGAARPDRNGIYRVETCTLRWQPMAIPFGERT